MLDMLSLRHSIQDEGFPALLLEKRAKIRPERNENQSIVGREVR
jgi:hypothetical protein